MTNSIKTISFMILLINFYTLHIICSETGPQHSRDSSSSTVSFHTENPSPTTQEPNINKSHRPFGPPNSNPGSNVSAQGDRSPRTPPILLEAITAWCIGSPTQIRTTPPSVNLIPKVPNKTDEFGTLSDIAWVQEGSPTTKVPDNSRMSPATAFPQGGPGLEGPEFSDVSPTTSSSSSPKFPHREPYNDLYFPSTSSQRQPPLFPGTVPQFPPPPINGC